jgi:hypothetical protein
MTRTRAIAAFLAGALLILGAGSMSGCAVHYYDPETGSEHIWGFGHMVMKATTPREGYRALVRGTEVIGLTVGRLDDQQYLTIGWEKRQRLEIVDESAAIRLEWPDSSFLRVRVGSEWPQVFGEPSPNQGGIQ